ncbi:MAG: CusA/CzcA family heavy metal efflux RND transporter [Flavobacterium sp. BFFFF1]|uniref:CusA/CzcA family heavy metal efflux RND transporter n=1 Tax=Flavobacterium sp. BFFFF1 TaxID=2015557 RepID=UPI000BC6C002|nr:CusA/CzcA family heavy metal efflux RND transporter [Flavobacterium sp. BFFFF1]OYU80698.1 MAG: CusA/CzcA family heavy metal efflux RND transporter [Flavobacterium sp. BFFFF1]
MLNKIIAFSVQNKLVVGLMVFALILWGVYSVRQLPIDAVPDITNNQVQIITTSPSNGAEDIERFVTFPVEQTMATITDIEEVRSFSRFGLSVVTVVFKEDVDVYWARQQVSERLAAATEQIPPGMGRPEMAPVSTGLGEIYQYIIHTKKGYEKKYDATELRTIQDWIVRRQLLGVPGIADVSSFGGFLKQYEIALNPDKLRSMNISIHDVFTALEKNNQNTGGAYIDKKPNAYFIRSEGLIKNIDDIENIVVKTNANSIPVLIRNVADVTIGAATRYGAMTRNSEGEVVGGIVLMLKGANASKVINNVKTRMAQIEKTLPAGVTIEPFLDRTKLVDNAIGTVTKNLAEGALIVIFVLVLLLGNLRAGLIVASVIPLSMLFAICLMNLFGVDGNLMSLGAIDFGLIVDGAVIIIEATMHYLYVKHKGSQITQDEMDSGVISNARKMMRSAAFGQIVILIVYLPILALVGVEGKMFRPMAQTVSFAIVGAFILSLTYVPVMSALFLNKKISDKPNISDKIINRVQRWYTPILQFALRAKVMVVGIAAGFLVLSFVVFSFLGAEFIPTLDEGDFAVEMRVLTGSSLSQTVEAAQKSAKVIKDNFPEVKEVIGKIGSSEIPTDPMPVEACDLMIILKDKSEWTSADNSEDLAEKMQATLEQHIAGTTFGFQQPIQMRFNELISGVKQDVAIKIYGEDLNKLTKYAKQIGSIARKIEGAEDIYIEEVSGLPQVVIAFHRDKIAQFGLNIEDVNSAIRAGFAGESAGLVFEGEKRFDLVVRLAHDNRQTLDDVKNLFVTAPNGNQVPLEQVADIDYKEGPNQIQRDDAKRRIIVGFNVRGRDVESIVSEIQEKIAGQVQFDSGYYPTYGGTFENLQAAKDRLSIAVPVSLALIFLLLFLAFRSAKQALLIFTAIPLSAIGGIFALWLRGMPFSISAGVGFIALFGVAVLNGIVLIAEFNALKKEGMTNLRDIVIRGTSVRLRPVIMTALVASLGFLPMAISHGSGGEVQKPLATVVIGGLFTATLLTLLILPILYIWFENFKRKTMKIPSAIIILILLFSANMSQAQMKPITMAEAIALGLKNNKDIAASQLDVTYQEQLKKAAIEIPKTEFSGQFGQINSAAKNDNYFSVSQTIPFPTVFSAHAALGNAMVKSSTLRVIIAQNEVAYRIKQAYLNLQYLYARRALLKKQDSIYSGFLKSAALRYKTGESTLLEQSTAETQLNETRNILGQDEANIEIYLSQLQVLLGSDEKIDIAETGFDAYEFEAFGDPAAISNNPALAYFQQQLEVADKQKQLERSKALPDLTFGYFNQSLIGATIDGSGLAIADSGNRFQGFQFGISVPIFFGAYNARVKSAAISREIAGKNLESQQVNLKGQYEQVLREFGKNRKSLEYYKSSGLPNADLLLSKSESAYRNGEISYSENLFNLRTANSIRENYLNAILQYNLSISLLEYLSGKNN